MLDPRTEAGWDAFVEGHPAGSVFHTSAWCRVLSETYGFRPQYVGAFDESGDLRAAVPLMLVKSWLTSKRLVGLPFSDSCAPLVHDDAHGLAALRAAQAEVDRISASRLELRGASPLDPSTTGMTNGTNFLRHIIPLGADAARMEAGLHSSARRAIRKAEREGLTVRVATGIAGMREFYRLMVLTRRKHGLLPQPWRFFSNLHKHHMAAGKGYLLLAEHQGIVIGGDLLLRFRDELTYKFNASDPQYLHLRPNNLLLWHAMRMGSELGCGTLDLGRCEEDNEGLRRFKLLWGSREESLSYYYYPANNGNGGLLANEAAQRSLALFVKYAPVSALKGMGSALYGNFG